MKLFHINHDSTRLLIFFCGFYTDPDCFIEFDNNKSDILFVFDYSNLDFNELSYFDYSPYVEINLIAYSYGVFASNIASPYLPPINNSTAVSGTFYPIDPDFGINPKIYDLMLNSFNLDVVKNFKNKMEMNSNGVIKETGRSVQNLKEELINIKNYVLNNETEEKLEFNKAVITTKDKIMPYSSQKNFWQGQNCSILEVNSGHFPFFYFKNFDEILEN